jgi:hypothetical protein
MHFSKFPSKGNTQILIVMYYCAYVTLQEAREEASHEFCRVTNSLRHCQQFCGTSDSSKYVGMIQFGGMKLAESVDKMKIMKNSDPKILWKEAIWKTEV